MRVLCCVTIASALVACGDDPVHQANVRVSGTANTSETLPACVEVRWQGDISGAHLEDACADVTVDGDQLGVLIEARPFDEEDTYVGTERVFLRFGATPEFGTVLKRTETVEDGLASVDIEVAFDF